MVGFGAEFPGLLPPLTWFVCIGTMLTNPQGKRLGDIAAGTIVIHERTPETWGWVPAMPPELTGWAATLDLTALGDQLPLAVRNYLARNRRLREPARTRLGAQLAAEVAACVTPPPPPGTAGWAYLAAVIAERHRRSVARIGSARAATASVWPELSRLTGSQTWVQPGGSPEGYSSMVGHMHRTRAYRAGVLVAENFAPADISDYLEEPDTIVWFDLCAPDEADLATISEELGLHPLAVEDAVHEHQRPKVDHYASHLFLTAYSATLNTVTATLTTDEISAFITKNALVTVRKSQNFDIDAVAERWDGASSDMVKTGVAFLLHGLLDYVVDTQFDAIQTLDTEIEGLEDQLFAETVQDTTMQRRTYELRKSLVVLRRVVLPMREVVNTLLRRDLRIIDQTMMPYFQDVYDHVLRASEWTESLRELITNIYETHLNLRGNRLNVIMKQVTSWAAIIAVPTAVTGWYGQNIPYPGFGHTSGLWASIIVTLTLSGLLYVLFRRKGWL